MAVTITAAELAEAVGVDSTTATRLLAVAAALVNRYAPDAPHAISNEAAIRTAGWLAEQPAAAIRAGDRGRYLDKLRAVDAIRAATLGCDGVAESVEDSPSGVRYEAACLEALSQRGGTKAAGGLANGISMANLIRQDHGNDIPRAGIAADPGRPRLRWRGGFV